MKKKLLSFCLVLIIGLDACNKGDRPVFFDNSAASKYSSVVIDKWIALQLRLMRNATGIPNVAFARPYAYSGVAAFEALAPAIAGSESISKNWNGLTGLPTAAWNKKYFWPGSVNTSLAFMNRNMFPGASAADKLAIDSLETALNESFKADEPANVIARSNEFGLAVGTAVFNWSETDGYKHQMDPYTSPVGPGLWVPTPPGFAVASTPYLGNNRPLVAHSGDHSQPGPPLAYSTDPASPFYKMVKQVYDVSLTLTADQTAMALWWRDIPGESSPGHWLSILQQVIARTGARLDKAAWSYALTGVCLNDACISCWQTKYKYTLVRPITYIRDIMGFTTWNAYLTTPAHPEYSSAHAVLSAATADAMTAVFGNTGSFTDHTYDYLGWTPRTFPSFYAIGVDAGNSRLYAGIHYQHSIDIGLTQGRKVTANILNQLKSGDNHDDK